MSLLAQRLRWDALVKEPGGGARPRVVLLSTFVIDPLVPYLGTELADRGLRVDIRVGPYGQVIQQCLDPASETARGGCDIVIVWPRFEDLWGQQPAPLDASDDDRATPLVELVEVATAAAQRWTATLVFVLPSVPETLPLGAGDLANPAGVIATATRARETALAKLRGAPGVVVADADRIVREVGTRHAYDARLATLARIPFTQELYAHAGRALARLAVMSRRPARKLVVVDGDNTLWGGVIGEVGWEHVELADSTPGEAFRGFQAFLLDLRRAGWLLALCSKNDDADIVSVFTRSEMRLQLSHFAARRVGWSSKAESIATIADELGFGLDAVVFIDDNPHEIAEVSSRLPDVLTVQMPADAVHWYAALAQSEAFDRPPPTASDRARAAQYETERARVELRDRLGSPEAYLADLGLQIRVYAPREEHIARLAQLVGKTNQFNLNGRRRTEAELRALCTSDRHIMLMADARDRFGDYGQIAVVIVELDGERAILDTYLMSCRVLGRGVEDAVLAATQGMLVQRGHGTLHAAVVVTPRNEPARTFFARLGVGEPGQLTAVPSIACPPHVELLR